MNRILIVGAVCATLINTSLYTAHIEHTYPEDTRATAISLGKPGNALAKGLASMLTTDALVSLLAGYFYLHKTEYPYLSLLLNALWTADFITFSAHHYGKEDIKNSFIKTLVEHPFLAGLLLAGHFPPKLIEQHSYAGVGVGGYLAYCWADNFLTHEDITT